MSDLPELLEDVTARMVEVVNAGIDESGGEHFGLGDLRPLAAELIDYTLNREFGEIDATLDGSQAPNGEAAASNLPSVCRECGIPWAECLSVVDGLCGACAREHPASAHHPQDCQHCRKQASLMPKSGQCEECPYKLTGVMAQTGCPNCPNREAA